MPHRARAKHDPRHPVHITLRAVAGLPSFRSDAVHRMFADILEQQEHRHYGANFRVLHFSLQKNHIHLVVEADSGHGGARAEPGPGPRDRRRPRRYSPMRSGVSGIKIAFARRLNMMLGRKGPVWDGLYHRRDLASPTEVLRCLGYIFENYGHHGARAYGCGVLDLRSSAWLFEGWDGEHVTFVPDRVLRWPVRAAKTWLASRGYLRAGRLPLREHRALHERGAPARV